MYNANFISDVAIPLPSLNDSLKASAYLNGKPIHHTRFSLVFSNARNFAIYTAHNIDGESLWPEGHFKRKDAFKNDPQIPREVQVNNNRGYRSNPWDRGHLVRRRSMHWGDEVDAYIGDQESFFYSNIAPQHSKLHHSAWGNIEDWMMSFADDHKKKLAVFTGPIFTESDPIRINRKGEDPIRIPAGFWKILALSHSFELRAAGFIVWQRDFDNPEPLGFQPFLEQTRITTIEFLTGLNFGNLRNLDPLRFGVELSGSRSLDDNLGEPPKPINKSAVVTSPFDIYLF